MKVCSKCGKEKELCEFHYINKAMGLFKHECKECRSIISKQYYLINTDKQKNKTKLYRLTNKDKVNNFCSIWRSRNKENYLAKRRKKRENNKNIINIKTKEHYRNSATYKLGIVLRSRLRQAFKNNQKTGSAIQDLGCSINKLKIHLQLKFHRNPRGRHEYMNWNNWSKDGWHIDHIIPLSSFNLSNREELLRACHYTNLQPMWAIDNLRKSDSI